MHRKSKKILIYGLTGLLMAGLTGCNDQDEVFVLSEATVFEQEEAQELTEDSAVSMTDSVEELCVFICGQVQHPGVYYLPPGSRVVDVIALAGGCLDTADICIVNQAEQLTDGVQIYIPAIGETLAVSSEEADDGRVHLNRAGREELMTLPGIGASKADAILEYREKQGNFTTIEELMNIPGIKEGVFNKIQDYITVE